MGEQKNSTDAATGQAARNRVRYIQFSVPKIFRKAVLTSTTVNTPKANREWSRLISFWGVSEGMAAMTGLSSTSERPADTENTTVPSSRPP